MNDSTELTHSDDTFVIGDCHGHLDRLELLLRQEGLLDDEGKRLRPEVEVIQLGDLCHLGAQTAKEDEAILETAPQWLDKILWGNHDRAIISSHHEFGGYRWSRYFSYPYNYDKKRFLELYLDLRKQGKLCLALERHGFLLTHAGLHPKFLDKPLTAVEVADFLNKTDLDESSHPIRDAVSFERGGSHFQGGILWRDAKEDLHHGFPQIFGHTAHPPEVRMYQPELDHDKVPTFTSYCIDIGDKGEYGKLAGIWLPSETVVQVDTDPDASV